MFLDSLLLLQQSKIMSQLNTKKKDISNGNKFIQLIDARE